MGRPHSFSPDFNSHRLSACIANYSVAIDVEVKKSEDRKEKTDWLAILIWIHKMAERVNKFCDQNKIAGDQAAEYWLRQFFLASEIGIDFSALRR